MVSNELLEAPDIDVRRQRQPLSDQCRTHDRGPLSFEMILVIQDLRNFVVRGGLSRVIESSRAQNKRSFYQYSEGRPATQLDHAFHHERVIQAILDHV